MAEWIVEAETLETLENGFYSIGNNGEPIVRCKDCKWIDLCKDPEFYEYKGANGFCSKGERKDEVEE